MNISYIISIICLALCLIMFFYFKWYIKRRISAEGLSDNYRKEVNGLIADMNSTADRNLQLLEDRIKKLKELLDDSSKRINVYVKDSEESRAGEALYTSLGRGIRAALKTKEEPPPETPPVVKPASKPVVEQVVSRPPSKRQIRAHIDLLLNEGIAPEEIVRRLGISIAEVQLAMNLRRPKH